jgi:hypothetical protein
VPYVDGESRRRLDPPLEALSSALAADGVHGGEGELNYAITRLLVAALGPSPRYRDYNAAIGVLECAKLELYRRAAAAYEDAKRGEHGDVYGPLA